MQRLGRVLRGEQDAVGVLHGDDRAAAGDALAREVGPVLHQLLGRDVERHAHRRVTLRSAPAAAGPSGRVHPAGDHPVGDLGDRRRRSSRRPPSAVITLDHREDPAGRGRGRRWRSRRRRRRRAPGRRRSTRLGSVEVVAVELLQRAAGEQRARADGVERGLLVAAAGDVVAEDPALAAGRGRSRRTGARRPAPAWPCRGCRGSARRAGWPCRPATACVPSIFS